MYYGIIVDLSKIILKVDYIFDHFNIIKNFYILSINLKRFIDNLFLESRQISGLSLGMPRRCLCCFM